MHTREVCVRSLLDQAWWNDAGMQNLGFLFAWARVERAVSGLAKHREAARRHLEYFNTHPYMASFVLGVVGSLEECLAGFPEEQRGAMEEKIRQLKKVMGATLAADGHI